MKNKNPFASPRRPADLLPNEREISYDSIHGFFYRHKAWIVSLSVTVILGMVAVLAWRLQEGQVRRQADLQLARANTVDLLQAVARDFQGTPASLIATVVLADVYFQQGQWERATACYQTVVDRHSTSLLAPSALIGLAAVAEATGKTEEAIRTYRSAVSNFPNSFQAPQAQFAAARLQENAGRLQEAGKSYEELIVRYPQSSWKNDAAARLQMINLRLKTPLAAVGT